MKVGAEYYWYHNDHLGTPQKLTTTSGAVVWSAKYSSFGQAIVDSESTVANPLRFPGQYEDAETGLHYNRFRYYNPEDGRYICVDDLDFSKILLIKEKILSQLLSRFSYPPYLLEKIVVGITNYFLQNEYIVTTLTDPYSYVQNNPVNWIDPYGLIHRPGSKFIIGKAIRPIVNRFISDPAAQRIITSGISGAVTGLGAGIIGGAIAGGAATGPLAGVGAVPGAIIGGISGFSTGLSSGLLYGALFEITGIPDRIENPCP